MILVLAGPVAFLSLWMQWRRLQAQRQRECLARQFRISLQSLLGALRAGVSVPQGIDYAAQESPEPMASHWQRLVRSLHVGKPLAEALQEFAAGVDLKEARWFVSAAIIIRSTGGSLAGILETLCEVLQERESLRDKVGALTAQGKASGVLLSLLPFVVLGAVAFIAPEMVRPLVTTREGQAMLAGMILWLLVGSWFIQRIVTLPVS